MVDERRPHGDVGTVDELCTACLAGCTIPYGALCHGDTYSKRIYRRGSRCCTSHTLRPEWRDQ
ncbi:uncharacterized protein ANIA_11361 [Aspergillus nidulans FGSC A4]|uniref:uncharacterized protein n=1 Tax=Emericella nidulans (strain FGSC A4 / ATCC 38163 / CBS 112.46 / NRRL 194 / M139) TaxID=227321 RepID=UPI0001B78523|nr:hypothetical protein [Aspergillus nidulans FGSC A4]CBF84131.1 TPA: hypothetical protein ANIA_11361 [Aspergillus nidulans FGSC A4]